MPAQVVGLVGGLGMGWQATFGIILALYFYSHYFFASGETRSCCACCAALRCAVRRHDSYATPFSALLRSASWWLHLWLAVAA